MATLGQALIWLAAAVAVVAWGVAFMAGTRAWRILRSEGRHDLARQAIWAWPSAARQMTGAAAAQATRVHTAILVFVAAILTMIAGSVLMVGLAETAPAGAS